MKTPKKDKSMVGWMQVLTQCSFLLFSIIPKLSSDSFLRLINATEKCVDYNRAFDLGLLSRYMYHSISTGETKWIEEFVSNQIRFMANENVDKIGKHIDHFLVILIIMIDHACELKQTVSSIFLNLCRKGSRLLGILAK